RPLLSQRPCIRFIRGPPSRLRRFGVTAFARGASRLPSRSSPRISAWRAKAGADDQDRTGDLVLTKDALCQLSYIGLGRSRVRQPAASADESAGLTPQRSGAPR